MNNNKSESVSKQCLGVCGFSRSFACEALKDSRNCVLSPASVYLSLGLASLGAEGETLQEFKRTLNFSDKNSLICSLQQLTQLLSASGCCKVAQRIYSGIRKLERSFKDSIFQTFGDDCIQEVDFKLKYVDLLKEINIWVSDHTQGKIKNLLSDDQLSAETIMVIVNTVHFKGLWDRSFKQSKPREFLISKDQKVTAQMMSKEDKLMFYQTDKLLYVDIPFKGEFSMEVFMPITIEGVGDQNFQKTLQCDKSIEGLRNKAEKQKMMLFLPRFKIEGNSLSLESILRRLGLSKCFSNTADFSAMDKEKTAKISDVVHQAGIEVNEEGAEAVAATGVVIAAMMAEFIPEVEINRPFYFTIVHKKSNSTPIFVGKLVDPTA